MTRAVRTLNFQSFLRSGPYLCGLSPGPHCGWLTQDSQLSSGIVLYQARENLFLGGTDTEERPICFSYSGARKGPWYIPLSTDGLGHSIREAVMVTKSSKLSRMLPCTAVSFSRKASVSTCSWVHTWMKRSSCMEGLAERGQ